MSKIRGVKADVKGSRPELSGVEAYASQVASQLSACSLACTYGKCRKSLSLCSVELPTKGGSTRNSELGHLPLWCAFLNVDKADHATTHGHDGKKT